MTATQHLGDGDFCLKDLESLKGVPGLDKFILQAIEQWNASNTPRRNDEIRCGSFYVQNAEGLGEIRLTFRFPFPG